MIILLAILFYIVSAIGAYMWQRTAYGPTGIWSTEGPEFMDIALVFIPVGNTIIATQYLIRSPKRAFSRPKGNRNYSKFYNVKH